MKLGDLRKLTVRGSLEVRFRVAGTAECLVDNQGICRLLDIEGFRDFNLEEEFARAEEFVVEPSEQIHRRRSDKPRSLNRQQRAELIESA